MQLRLRPFLCFALLNLGIWSITNAQVISDPLSNKPYYTASSEQSGNPLVTEGWNAGTILGENGTRYKGILVNYDLLQKKVVFKLKEELIYIFNDPIKEFTIDAGVGGKNRRGVRWGHVHAQLPGLFVEVLASGSIGFYKQVVKSIIEVTDYNSMPRKVIEEKINYYLLRDGNLQRTSLSKKGLQEAFAEKQASVDAFIKKETLSAKNEADWIRIIDHLNEKK